MDGTKVCKSCGETKSVAEFGVNTRTNGKPYWRARCRDCTRSGARPEALRQYHPPGSAGWQTNKNLATKRRWTAGNPEKRRAHKAVENALRDGRLRVRPCERCGDAVGVHAHHDDYSKPLDVTWLCPRHHRERHRELRAAAQAA